MTTLVRAKSVSIRTPGGRVLFNELDLRLGREKVALVGRNGVGKSTLLAALAGHVEIHAGVMRTASPPLLVPQVPAPMGESGGEHRRRLLAEARVSGADILLLDEPTEDLDDDAICWLRGWLRAWSGCLVVASHDRRLLQDLRHFLVVSESGCRYVGGTLEELDAELDREHDAAERAYAKSLAELVAKETHLDRALRRKARKKRSGRPRELDRATPPIRLNAKRGQAQTSFGRFTRMRESRLAELRRWSKSARRAIAPGLDVALPVPELPSRAGDEPVLVLEEVSVHCDGRALFGPLSLRLDRQRVAVVGPNGSGKTTLLEVMLGRRPPTSGRARRDPNRIGSVAQAGADFLVSESLASRILRTSDRTTEDEVAALLALHKFPLALARRPLASLSPGERARAALLSLLVEAPVPTVLVLDEPTFSLDLVADRATTKALREWPGGLVVASHDRRFLDAIGIDIEIQLGPSR